MTMNNENKSSNILFHKILEELDSIIDEMYADIQKMDEQSCIKKIESLFIDMQKLTSIFYNLFDEKTSAQQLNNLNSILIEVEKAMVSGDYTLMCDILFYEIKPMLHHWKDSAE